MYCVCNKCNLLIMLRKVLKPGNKYSLMKSGLAEALIYCSFKSDLLLNRSEMHT